MEANSKFRVGDLVRVVSLRSSLAGVACVVKATNSGMQSPYFVESADRSCGNWFSEDELTLVKPAPTVTNNPEILDSSTAANTSEISNSCEPAPVVKEDLKTEPRFQVGGRVRIRKPESGSPYWPNCLDKYDGREGVIGRVDPDHQAGFFYNVTSISGWRFFESYLEPVEAEVLTQAKMLQRVLYLAGPMRGIAFYNFPMFDRVAAALRDVGYEVINPADEDRKEDNFDPTLEPKFANPAYCFVQPGMDFSRIIRRCFEAVMRCDEIVLLPGWENSVGAIAELFIAVWSGKRIQLVYPEENDQMQFVSTPAIDLATAISRIQIARDETKQSKESDDEDILDIAARITRGDRQAVYGPPEQDFRKTADMWTGLFQYMLAEDAKFEPRHVAMALICMKMSRECHQRKKDNWVDIAGYARCGSLCE
jgi:hypothetical protein